MIYVQIPTLFGLEDPPPGIILCFDATEGTEDLQMRAICGLRPILPEEVHPVLSGFTERAMPDATLIAYLYTGWVNDEGEVLGIEDGVMVVTAPDLN